VEEKQHYSQGYLLWNLLGWWLQGQKQEEQQQWYKGYMADKTHS
jgi:hypothetical protein